MTERVVVSGIRSQMVDVNPDRLDRITGHCQSPTMGVR